jgi:hypothetical protein
MAQGAEPRRTEKHAGAGLGYDVMAWVRGRDLASHQLCRMTLTLSSAFPFA